MYRLPEGASLEGMNNQENLAGAPDDRVIEESRAGVGVGGDSRSFRPLSIL